MSRSDTMQARVRRALMVSAGIIGLFLLTWYFVSTAVLGDHSRHGFTVSPSTGVAPLEITVKHEDYDLLPGTELEINFGDGTVIKNPEGNDQGSVKLTTVKHTYGKAGRYSLNLSKRVPATNPPANGPSYDTYSFITTITVQEPEPLEFYAYPRQGDAPLRVEAGFIDYHFFPDMVAKFDFGDGTVVTTPKIEDYGSVQFVMAEHVYLKPGLYTLTTTHSSPSLGFTQTATEQIVVDDQDGINFLAQIDTPSDPLKVTVVANDPDRFCEGSIITGCKGVSWIFGDGTTIADAPFTVSHRLPKAGTYRIALDVRGTLRVEKFFTLDGKGGIREVVSPPAATATTPKLTTLKLNGTVLQLAQSLAITDSDRLELRGTGTPGSIVRGIVRGKPGYMILTKAFEDHVSQFLVNPEGEWVWQPLAFLPPVDGTFTILLQGADDKEPTQVLEVTLTKSKPTAAGYDNSANNADNRTASSSKDTKVVANEAEIVPTQTKATGFKGTLVATGSSFSFMFLLSLLIAGAASFLILRHPSNRAVHGHEERH